VSLVSSLIFPLLSISSSFSFYIDYCSRCGVIFLQYSTGCKFPVILHWLTPKHLKQTIHNVPNFKSPACIDVLWSLHTFSRVDFHIYDLLLQISVLGPDTIAFGTEAKYDASCSNTLKRCKCYSIFTYIFLFIYDI
jgi:hypothetical protein